MIVYPLHIEVSGDLRSLDMVSFVGGKAKERIPFFDVLFLNTQHGVWAVSACRAFLTMTDV